MRCTDCTLAIIRVYTMDKYQNLKKNTILVFVGSLSSKLLAVLMLPFYTAWLSVSDFGIVDLITTYVALIMSVVTLCMTDAIFRFPQGQIHKKQSFYFSSGIMLVILSLLLTGICCFLFLLSTDSSSWGVFGEYAGFIYILLILSFLQLYVQQFSKSIGKLSIYVKSGILLTLVTALFSFVLIPYYSINGYLFAQAIGLVLTLIYISFQIKVSRYISIQYVSWSTIRQMLEYSIPMIPNATLWWVLGASNRLFLEHYHGVDSVGIYAVSNRFPSMITMVFNAFFLSWQISVLREFGKPEFVAFYNRIMRFYFIILVGLSIILSISSYWIVEILSDYKYIEAWQYIPFLGLASIFSALSSFVGTIFMATKTTRYFFVTSFWGSLLCLLLNFMLIPIWGLMGAAISLSVSHFVIYVLRIIKSRPYVSVAGFGTYLIQIGLVYLFSVCVVYIGNLVFKLISLGLIISGLFYFNRNFLKELWQAVYHK